MRVANIKRETKETSINTSLNIDGDGKYEIITPIGLFTHMLNLFSKSSLIDLRMDVKGDLEVDQHHTIEDCGIVLGNAIKVALKEKKGINRAGYFIYPMDEALAVVAIDIGGRPFLQFDARFKRRFCGDLDTDLLEDFFYGFCTSLGANVVVKVISGRSDHHKIEAIFKAFGKAMKTACSLDPRMKGNIPSTKGII